MTEATVNHITPIRKKGIHTITVAAETLSPKKFGDKPSSSLFFFLQQWMQAIVSVEIERAAYANSANKNNIPPGNL